MSRARHRVVVIGGGFGGLSAAALLAHAGASVTLIEAADSLGGKAGTAESDGGTFDTGPSLFTIPEAARSLFRRCGEHFDDHVELRRLSPAFHYQWADGTTVAVDHDLEQTLEAVRGALGRRAATELEGFLAYSRKIWEASAPAFVLGDAPSFGGMFRLNLKTLASFRHIDASSTMEAAIRKRVSNPYLRDLLRRFATYNGSDVRVAPATLNCIAWVELGLGSWGVQGGIGALARAMVGLCERNGVDFRLGQPVTEIATRGACVTGVIVDGQFVEADAVVCNADVRHLTTTLLPKRAPARPYAPSMSGWNAVMRVPRQGPRLRSPHTVLFPSDYLDEFAAIFDRHEITPEPTIYACNQSMAHGRAGWTDADALFLMVNAPSASRCQGNVDFERLREQVLERAVDVGLLTHDSACVWTREPSGLAARFPGSDGSLYGAASNSVFSAFKRPANRSELAQGLYLAGGSAHPGGGVPLCILSGFAASRALLSDARFGDPQTLRAG